MKWLPSEQWHTWILEGKTKKFTLQSQILFKAKVGSQSDKMSL